MKHISKKITGQIFDVAKAEKVTLSNNKVINTSDSDKRVLENNPNMRIAIFGNFKSFENVNNLIHVLI